MTTWINRIATTKALQAYRKHRARKRFVFLPSLFRTGEDDADEDGLYPAYLEHLGVKQEQQVVTGTTLVPKNGLGAIVP